MRNAQQELNLHVNALQAELERLTAEIEQALAAPPSDSGERRVPWKTPGLPAHVIACLLEGLRDRGFAATVEDDSRAMSLVLRPADEAVPLPVISR